MKKKELILTISLLGIDQITKFLAEKYLLSTLVIIPNFFQLQLVYNTGGAWSIFKNQVLFLIIVGLCSLVILSSFKKDMEHYSYVSLIYSFLYAGILGNLLDRIVFSHVKDFLSFTFLDYHFPVFNFADIFIVFGALLFILSIFRGEKSGKNFSRYRNKRENR